MLSGIARCIRLLTPPPVTIVMAGLMLMAAIGVSMVTPVMVSLDLPGAAYFAKASGVLLVMPLYVLIGGAIGQLATQIVAVLEKMKPWLEPEPPRPMLAPGL